MDETISHNPSSLPKHCVDTTGHLRKDLLRPASQTYHQNMILSGTEIGTIFDNRNSRTTRFIFIKESLFYYFYYN